MNHTCEEVVLKNGSRGLLINVPGSTVFGFSFHFRAGNRFTRSPEVYETAHVMEHMAFGANSLCKDEHEFVATFTRNGAYHNAYTTDYSMVYHGHCADFEWERIMELNGASIASPKFREDHLVAELGNVKSELHGYLNDHSRLLWPRLMQELGDPGLTFSQRLKTLPNITLSDIREHYNRTHTSDNLRFIIGGNLDDRREQIIEMIEKWPLERGERHLIPIEEYHAAPRVLIRRKEAATSTFGWVLTIPRRISDMEQNAMNALDHILTGTMYSRIFGTARKRGLAYGMFSETTISEGVSLWEFGGEATNDSLKELFSIIRDELKRIIAGDVSEADVEAAKQYALGRHQIGAQTVGQITRWYGDYFFDGTIDDYNARPEEIKAITAERMIETAREFLKSNAVAMGAVGSLDSELLGELEAILGEII